LPHFSIRGAAADLIFLVIFLGSFLSNKKGFFIYAMAILGGLFLEYYSYLPFFGLWIITLFLLALIIRRLNSAMRQFNIVSLLITFLIAFLLFKILPLVLVFIFTLIQKRTLLFPWSFSWQGLLISLSIDFVIAVFSFYLYEFIYQKRGQRN